MERLTGKDELGYYAPREVTLNCLKQRGELVDHLAAYEDTGLTPKEIAAMQHTLDEYHKVADVAPVAHGLEYFIRCKDCKYAAKAQWNKKGYRICQASHMEITDDDFCSYAERKEPNDEQMD